MKRDNELSKLFTRRAAILGAGKLALISVLAGRMYYLQVVSSSRYTVLAEENRINLRLLLPPRGLVVDRFGTPFAENRHNYRVLIVPERTPSLKRTLEMLGQVIPVSDYERTRVLRASRRSRDFVPIMVRENLSWEEVSRVEVNTPELPGLMIDVGQSRVYPHGALAAHVVGYVGAVSERELTGDPVLQLPGFRIGKNGVEKVHDLALRGKAGTSQVEVNAVGRVIRELDRSEGDRGQQVVLTLDFELQKFTAERLSKEQSAAAAVVDVRTGEVLALSSVPSFDPNLFNTGITPQDWRGLVSDPRSPLTNKAIAGHYAPGSTFKPMVALAALEAGVVHPEHTVFCKGRIKLGDTRFHCWKRGGHGWLDMHGAIQQSCDIYFYDVARRVGVDRISEMANRFGLGANTGIDLPGEKSGLMPTRDWKAATIGSPWQLGETLISGIGQGFVLATPLQLAIMMARLVNGGYAVAPWLTHSVGLAARPQRVQRPKIGKIDISPQFLEVVIRGMEAVTNHRRGTAYRARIKSEDIAMGGKTGTSQVRRISLAERRTRVLKNKERPWRERDHALFIGFAPVGDPRYAVAVVVEHGGGGSAVAAPIARDILIKTQERDPARRGVPAVEGVQPADRPAPPRSRGV
jgi:penicillin-binding protein 2